ncbi:hypothetical protein AX15_002821 [Amanita polypyramis BW_CC]|nr:hypothetical protein AX15_002821 [Amanita polypyramis BW_CC]
MGKKKWYVVTVGKAVGVFATWLEVAPLVTGVSGAQHQSFPTEEEALQAFRDEFSKGSVQIINAGTVGSPSLSCFSRREAASARSTPRQSHSHGVVSAPQTPASGSRRVGRSNPCVDERHHGVKREDMYQERITDSPRYSSPRYSPSASVRTPSGLEYYPRTRARTTPKSNRSLTPLGSPVKLSFVDTDINMTRSRHSCVNTNPELSPSSKSGHKSEPLPAAICDDCATKCIHCNRKVGNGLPDRSLSDMFTQMHVSYPSTTYDKRMDPRSPMAKTGYLPTSTSSMSIGRPSPSQSARDGSESALLRGL